MRSTPKHCNHSKNYVTYVPIKFLPLTPTDLQKKWTAHIARVLSSQRVLIICTFSVLQKQFISTLAEMPSIVKANKRNKNITEPLISFVG